MSESEDERPESAEQTEPKPAAKPEPKPEPKDAGSIFESNWGGALGSKPTAPLFAPPPISTFKPPSGAAPKFEVPSVKPRTSEGGGAVSGAFELPELPKPESESKPEPAEDAPETSATKPEPAPEKAEAETSKPEPAEAASETSATKPEPAEDATDAETSKPEAAEEGSETSAPKPEAEEEGSETSAPKPEAAPEKTEASASEEDDETASEESRPKQLPRRMPAPKSAPPPEPEPSDPRSSGSMLIILAVAAAIVLTIVFVNRSGTDDEGGQGPARPNTATNTDKSATKVAPRPPEHKTRLIEPDREPKPSATTTDAAPSETTTGEAPSETTTGEAPSDDTGEAPSVEPEPIPTPPASKPAVDNPRDPSLIPANTPAENAKAFSKLPVAPSDGPPIGGIGRSGIHIDAVSMGEGRDNVGCDQPSRSFTTGNEYINVCFRVIHPRASETLRVIWEKDGAVSRRGKVRVPENLHAYKTRAYLQVRPEYVGKWRVRITPEGEETIDLAVAEFTIE